MRPLAPSTFAGAGWRAQASGFLDRLPPDEEEESAHGEAPDPDDGD